MSEAIAAEQQREALNDFRLAGIVQDIVGRVRDGTANSPHTAQQSERVVSLAQFGRKFLTWR